MTFYALFMEQFKDIENYNVNDSGHCLQVNVLRTFFTILTFEHEKKTINVLNFKEMTVEC
jgi:hypothetical protein